MCEDYEHIAPYALLTDFSEPCSLPCKQLLTLICSTVADVARKIMGDAPIAFIEGIGGMRVAEDDPVAVGKNDASCSPLHCITSALKC